MQYGALLSEAASYAGRLAALSVVPLLASLARWRDVVALGSRTGSEIGIKLSLPHPIADLWTFVDAPRRGRNGLHVDVPAGMDPELSATLLLAVALYAVGIGLLMAGYVGSVDEFLRRGRYDFLANVRRFGARMVGFQAVVYAYLLVLVVVALDSTVLVVVGLVVGFLAWALLYLAPFLVVVEDRPLGDAFRRSHELVTSRGEPIAFLLLYAAVVLLGSLPVSLLANLDLPGVLVAAILASVVGHLLTVLTVLFARRLVEPDALSNRATEDASGTGGPGDPAAAAEGD